MKKMPAVISLFVLIVILGFSNVSWAVNRPNTPECADVNGSFDADTCLIQYVEPLQKELRALWFQLVKLQGKRIKDNPWIFKSDSPACDPTNQRSYDKKICRLSMTGKLAQEKYRIREQVKIITHQVTVKQQTKQLAEKLAALQRKNEELINELATTKTNAQKEKNRLVKQNETQSQEVKKFKDELERESKYAVWFGIFSAVLIIIAVYLIFVMVNLQVRVKNLETRLLAPGEKPGSV